MDVQLVSALPSIESSVVGIDIETTRRYKNGDSKAPADPRRDRIVSLQVSDGNRVWVLTGNYNSALPLLINPDVKKVGHNIAFDIGFLNQHLGIQIDNVHDTLIAERTIHAGNNALGHGLDDVLARRYGVFTDKSIRNQFEDHTGALTEEQLEYAGIDAYYLVKMREDQLREIGKAGLGRVISVENRIIPIVAQMSLNGIGFDRDLWGQYQVQIEQRLLEIARRVASYLQVPSYIPMFGAPSLGVDLNSADQLKDYLWKYHGLEVENTREETFQMIMDDMPDHPACRFLRDVLEWKEWDKRRSWAYHEHIHPITGRIHPLWKPFEARTGRVACERPNLMQVPRWTGGADEPNFRLLFLPTADGRVFIIADYSQQEPRIFAQVAGDKAMRAACREKDVYIAFGRDVYKREITKGSEERQTVKNSVLARLYGGQPKKLSSMLHISLEAAEEFARQIDQAYPTAKKWSDEQLHQLMMRGYTTTLLGRKRYFPEIREAPQNKMGKYRNQAVNTPIQGSGADMFKLAATKLYDVIKANNYDAFPALFVHDELVVECREDQAQEVYYQLVGCMEEAGRELCPDVEIIAEGKINEKWVKA